MPRALLLAALLACSGNVEPPAGLVLAINTNDLVIAIDELGDDTNLIGLYLRHSDAAGRVLSSQAFEAAPLRTPDRVIVPFPASFSVQPRRGEEATGDRLHIRLIAYRPGRVPLSMREMRVAMPQDRAQLARLNLFFTNQNVIDTQPGMPPVQPNDPPEVPFERFRVRCAGAPAADGQTADDAGGCIPLDVPTDDPSLEAYDVDRGIPGADPDRDSCYDLARAFEPRDDRAIVRIDKASLPSEGACTLVLPAAFDPARFNVAMLTNEIAFPSNDYQGKSLRPLANGLAFRLAADGRSVSLPESVCSLARRAPVDALLFSQRTDAWGGRESVCAEWSLAGQRHSFDGPPPTPIDEGGTDGGVPDGASDGGDADAPVEPELPSHELELSPDLGYPIEAFDVAGLDGEAMVVVAATDGSNFVTKTLHVVSPEVQAPNVISDPVEYGGQQMQVHAVRVAGGREFYLSPNSYSYALYQIAPIAAPDAHYVAVVAENLQPLGYGFRLTQGRDAAYVAFIDAGAQVAPLASKTSVGAPLDVSDPPAAEGPLGALGGRLLIHGSGPHLDCSEQGRACSTASFDPTVEAPAQARFAAVDGALLMPATTTGFDRFTYQEGTGWSPDRVGPTSPIGRVVGFGDNVCWSYGTAPFKVQCASYAGGAFLDSRFPVGGTLARVALAADDRRLYVAYQCHVVNGTDPHVHYASLPWSKIRALPGADAGAALVTCEGHPD